jgi:antitoxin ChpS
VTDISIKQSGDDSIVSIPKAIAQTLGLDIGTKLDLTIEGNKIVLTPLNEKSGLETLSFGRAKKYHNVLTQEERDWINTHIVG